MSSAPYAGPPQWGGPPLPPRSGGRTAAIVAGCIALALAVPTLIVATVYLAGSVARRSAPPRPITSGEYVPLGYQRVRADESGPSFVIRGPDGWRISARTNDALLDYRRIGFDGPDERIAITTYAEDTSTSVEDALAHTVKTIGARGGLVAAEVPRARSVAGHDALVQRMLPKSGGAREVWVCVFRYAGARWVALYAGPLRDVREEPDALGDTLSDVALVTRDPLSTAEVAAALNDLDGWSGDTTGIRRTVTCATFMDAVRLVVAVADIAEELDHHPDVDLRYRDVTFACWTHTAGGVTAYDTTLARRIDAAVTLAGC